jgi:hypothetical protein
MMIEALTVCTHDAGYFRALRESCERQDLPLTVLGFGQPWRGLNGKFQLVREALARRPPDRIVLFVDAFDVLLLQHRDVLRHRFDTLLLTDGGGGVLFGVENPRGYAACEGVKRRVFGACGAKTVNTGVYMGRVDRLRPLLAALHRANADATADDQRPGRERFLSFHAPPLPSCLFRSSIVSADGTTVGFSRSTASFSTETVW